MEIREALPIVRKLVDGVHPETGEVLQTDCLYNHPQAVRMSASARKDSYPAMRERPGRTKRTRKSAHLIPRVISGSGESMVALRIQTTAAIPGSSKAALSIFMFVFPIAGILWFARTETRGARTLNGAVTLLFQLLFTSCGGGLQGGGGGNGSPGTSPGTYSIAITATCGSV